MPAGVQLAHFGAYEEPDCSFKVSTSSKLKESALNVWIFKSLA